MHGYRSKYALPAGGTASIHSSHDCFCERSDTLSREIVSNAMTAVCRHVTSPAVAKCTRLPPATKPTACQAAPTPPPEPPPEPPIAENLLWLPLAQIIAPASVFRRGVTFSLIASARCNSSPMCELPYSCYMSVTCRLHVGYMSVICRLHVEYMYVCNRPCVSCRTPARTAPRDR